jgi:DNA-directed RNA polymerase subunit RPC12/RpoP
MFSTVRLGASDGISVYLCVQCNDEFQLVDEETNA